MLNIIAGVALMLWGLRLVRLGTTRGFGLSLRSALSVSTSNKILALLAGAAVTTMLQSSTATTMIVASFAGQSMITTGSALALVLGADVGTTLVAQILSFDLSWLVPVFMISGVVLFSFDKVKKTKNIGRILIGLSLVLLALRLITDSSAPIKDSDVLPLILQPLQDDVFLGVIVAALITWIAHSSLAIVLLLVSLSSSGVLPVPLALVMVLGANLGGTVAPLLSTLRDTPEAMRVPAGNMMMRLVGVLAALPFLDMIMPFIADLSADPARQIVNFHMAFNVALALVFLPFTEMVAAFCTKCFPDKVAADDPSQPKYLSEKEIDTPAIALAGAARETLRMADIVQSMLEDTITTFRSSDESIVYDIREKDDILDDLYESIKRYMARLTEEYMDGDDAQRYVQVLTFATNLEHVGDVIDKNLMQLALKKIRNQGRFSDEGFREIEAIHNSVLDSVRLSQNVFVSGDINLARKLLEEKEKLRQAEINASSSHIERLREGNPDTIATTSLHLDIIRDYRRINTYVCTVAYPLLEEEGLLRTTRLRSKKKKQDIA